MVVTEGGNTISVRAEQELNAPAAISLIPVGKVIDFNLAHDEKAFLISVIEFGITTEVRLVPLKAFAPRYVTDSGILIC